MCFNLLGGGGYNSLLAGYRGNLACKQAPAIASGHPELDSGSIHSVENVINRFRVKHGMTKLGDNRFFTSLGERSQLCESNELQMRVRVNLIRANKGVLCLV